MGGVTDGTIHIRNSDGNLYVRYLYRNGSQWVSNANWLDNHFVDRSPALVRATNKISLSQFAGEFCIMK